MEKWNIACLHRLCEAASAEQGRQIGNKNIRRNPIIPSFPAYRQAGFIPSPIK